MANELYENLFGQAVDSVKAFFGSNTATGKRILDRSADQILAQWSKYYGPREEFLDDDEQVRDAFVEWIQATYGYPTSVLKKAASMSGFPLPNQPGAPRPRRDLFAESIDIMEAVSTGQMRKFILATLVAAEDAGLQSKKARAIMQQEFQQNRETLSPRQSTARQSTARQKDQMADGFNVTTSGLRKTLRNLKIDDTEYMELWADSHSKNFADISPQQKEKLAKIAFQTLRLDT